MTLEQEVKLAAKHAYQKPYKEACKKFDKKTEKACEKGYKEACEKFDKKAEKEKIMVIKKAAEEKLESARNFKESGVSLEIISKCTGLSLEQIQNL